MESVGYAVRVQAFDGYSDRIQALVLMSDYDAVLAVKHMGDSKENPHFHIVIRTNVESQTFRKRMKKVFPDGKGNGHMSIKAWDGDNKALSYLFHEEPDVVPLVRKGLTDTFITELRQLNQGIQEAVKDAKQKASHHLKDMALEYFRSLKLKHPPTDQDVCKWMVLAALRSDKYMPPRWQLQQMVPWVKFKLLEGDTNAEEEFAQNIARQMYEYS